MRADRDVKPPEVDVLIVDDNPDDRAVLRRFLRGDPARAYRFHEASSGREAVETYERIRPGLVLLDYLLPDCESLELVPRLGGDGAARAPLIMLTGSGSERIAVRALQLGASDYLVKGNLSPQILSQSVDRAIETVRLERLLGEQQRDLERKNRDLEIFASAAAHDLKEPLQTLLNLAAALEARLEPGDEHLARIRATVLRMGQMIDGLLDYGRLGMAALETKPIELGPLFARCVEDLAALVAQTGGEVTVGERLPAVEADERILRQVVLNLLKNGLLHSRPGGAPRVQLDARDEGRRVRIVVADDGPGIAADDRERIFEVFQRGATTAPGTGVGLAVVRRGVEALGGEIELESEPGRGTTFSVLLPAVRPTD